MCVHTFWKGDILHGIHANIVSSIYRLIYARQSQSVKKAFHGKNKRDKRIRLFSHAFCSFHRIIANGTHSVEGYIINFIHSNFIVMIFHLSQPASQSVTQSVNVMVHNTFHFTCKAYATQWRIAIVWARIHKVYIPLLSGKVAIVKMNVWYEKWVWNLCHLHTFPCSSVLTAHPPLSTPYTVDNVTLCVHVSPIPQIMWWYFASCLLNNQNLLRVSRTLVTMLQIKSVWNEERERETRIHTYRELEGNVNQRIWRACVCCCTKTKQNKEVKRPNKKIRLENKMFFSLKQYKLPK